eukprot:c29299_g2_i2 orf=342-2360(+)
MLFLGQSHLLLSILLSVVLAYTFAEGTKFIFNGFKDEHLTLDGIAVMNSGKIQLTNVSTLMLGRALYHAPVQLKDSTTNATFSFSTTFVFSIIPKYPNLGGHGMAFIMTPSRDSRGAFPAQYLGMLNTTNMGKASNHLFAVEFDTVLDLGFSDINDNHIGIDINSMISVNSTSAVYQMGKGKTPQDKIEVNLKGGKNIQAWIQYNSLEQQLNVSISNEGQPRPAFPLLSVRVDLSTVLEDYMYVGFSASTGSVLSGDHNVLAWSFNNNGEAQTLNLSRISTIAHRAPTVKSTECIVTVCIASIVLAIAIIIAAHMHKRWQQLLNEKLLGDWQLEYGPRKFNYKDLSIATKGFHEKELLGVGGFGRVYKGVLPRTGLEVAVKRLSHESKQGLREFFAELSSIGRLRHRNLLQLQGWSRHKGELYLVYEYMPNGSLDKMLFGSSNLRRSSLGWVQRCRILRGIAAALVYLHEEWEQQVLHRDVKASNVLLDTELNGKLGDFGLARLYDHGQYPHTTRVVGTLGYLAPELTRTGKATASTDVYSFGILLLEMATGRRCIQTQNCEEEAVVLVDWVWELHKKGRLLEAADLHHSVSSAGEMETLLLLGLLCSHPNPLLRPTMRQVVRVLGADQTSCVIMPSLDLSIGSPSQAGLEASSSLWDCSSFDASTLSLTRC